MISYSIATQIQLNGYKESKTSDTARGVVSVLLIKHWHESGVNYINNGNKVFPKSVDVAEQLYVRRISDTF